MPPALRAKRSTPRPSGGNALRSKSKASKRSIPFDYDVDYKSVNLRERPELYRIGKGEQGVLMCEPYKSEILPHWKFATPSAAQQSSEHIYSMFISYLSEGDFPGADMSRKFLQMGYTRSRRYANHKGGRKYVYEDGQAEGKGKVTKVVKKVDGKKVMVENDEGWRDEGKEESASIFKEVLEKAKNNQQYIDMTTEQRRKEREWASQNADDDRTFDNAAYSEPDTASAAKAAIGGSFDPKTFHGSAFWNDSLRPTRGAGG